MKCTIFSHVLDASIAKHLRHQWCGCNFKRLSHCHDMVRHRRRAVCSLHSLLLLQNNLLQNTPQIIILRLYNTPSQVPQVSRLHSDIQTGSTSQCDKYFASSLIDR